MSISYTGKLAAHEAKFKNVAAKFKHILDLNEENQKKEVFAKTLINPNKALLESEKEELTAFIKNACDAGAKREISECKTSNPLSNSLLLKKMLELVESGVVDVTSYQDKSVSYEEQIDHLIDLFESADEALLYSQKYPEIGEMNTAVREFRDAVFSLLQEFRPYQVRNVKFGVDEGKVQESFDADFKATAEVLKEAWGGSDEEKNTDLAVYANANTAVSIHRPDLHESPRIDSKEAIENLDKKASYHFTSAVGAMEVTYFKNIALPHLIESVCKLAKTDTSLSSQISDHIVFNKAKYVMANFDAIFKGMESNYDADIKKAVEDMQNIRVKTDGVASYDLDTFFEGISRVIKIISAAEQQHGEFESDITSISDLCPELQLSNNIPLLGVATESAEESSHEEL